MEQQNLIGIVSIVIQLIFLEGILSIDNAAVLGAMVAVLPDDRPAPYPRALRFLQGFTDRVLGMQQAAALKVGLLGAYAGRGLMLVLAAWIVHNPILKLVGAAYLIKLAFDNLSQPDQPGEEAILAQHRREAAGFWIVVLNVELADLAFSLDNVVAAVALSDKLWVVMVGVALGILTMRFAAGIFTWLIKREPILATAAYIIVLNIGVELVLDEAGLMQFPALLKFAISISTLLLCVAYAHLPILQRLGFIWRWLGEGMGNINELVDWALKPLKWLLGTLAGLVGGLFARPAQGLSLSPADEEQSQS